jgi:serine/threonine-protein kinase
MSNAPQRDDTVQAVVERFATAWEQALHDQRHLPPRVEDFMASARVVDPTALRSELERVDRDFRNHPAFRAKAGAVDEAPGSTDTAGQASMDSARLRQPQTAGPTPTDGGLDASVNLEPHRQDTAERGPSFVQAANTIDRPASNEPGAAGHGPQIREYEILEELGRGGISVVYRAFHHGLKREVALKMILAGAHASPGQLERFRAEAEAVAQLQHANIVQIYDVGQYEGLPYFSLEFVDGGSLEDIAGGKPLVPTHAAEMVGLLAQTMQFAHERGIVHRDLRPANVLLTQDGRPKITDFGLERQVEDDSGQTRTGTIMGTPSFMAPEQGRGQKDIGPPADIYALGAMLYTLLTGRPPFLAATAMDTIIQLTNDDPVPPSKLQPKIPRDIETICLTCLNKEPERRYETAGKLADDLARFCRGEPILTPPMGNVERVWRWCRRNPWIAMPSAAAALVAIAIMLGGPLAAAIIYQQKQQAVTAQALAERNEQIANRNAEIAVQQKEIAKEQRILALNALNGVVTQVEEQLRDRPELSELRQTVLRQALNGLDQVSRTDENTDLADRSIGAAHQRMGAIFARAGEAEEALAQYKRSLLIFDKLLDQDKRNDRARWDAALTHDGIGDVKYNTLVNAQEVRGHFEHALLHREILAGRGEELNSNLTPLVIKESIVQSYGHLGKLALDSFCNPLSAVNHFQKATSHAEALLDILPDGLMARQSLADAWYGLAQALYRLNRPEEADAFATKSMQVRQQLLDGDSQNVKAQRDVAALYWLRGDVHLHAGRDQQALDAYQAAHAMHLSLLADDPEDPERQKDLAKSLYRLGTVYERLSRDQEAQAAFAECLALNEKILAADPENRGKQLQLALAQARCGQIDEAAETTDSLRATLDPNPGTLFRLARSYALCALALQQEQHAEDVTDGDIAERRAYYLKSALESLGQAVENGFRDPTLLRCHPDLVAVRNTPDFEALLESLGSSP